MFSIIADAMMTATRSTRSSSGKHWDAPDHWRRSEGLGPRDGRSHYGENHRILKWYELTGPK